MEFVGEDAVGHTPRNGRIELTMGTAFDIIATRKRTDFQRGRGANWMEESFEITLRKLHRPRRCVHLGEDRRRVQPHARDIRPEQLVFFAGEHKHAG